MKRISFLMLAMGVLVFGVASTDTINAPVLVVQESEANNGGGHPILPPV